MPLLFRFDPDRDLLIHIGHGLVSIEDIGEVRQARTRAGVPAAVYHTFNDMRDARFDFDMATLRAHESDVSTDDLAGYRQAELVTDPETTAMLMIWKKWVPEGVLVEIFSTPNAAYEWLGVEEREGDLDH